jgi:hypothetical protein
MGEMISHTIEGQAFLGAMAEKESAKKVEWIADKMINVVHFRPDSDEDRKKASDYSSRIINGMGFEADTVDDLISVEKDDKKTARQKEIAKENLEVLAKGTFLAMQKSMDIEAMDLLGQGSAVEIDNFLPEPLKGLGEKIVKNVISNEVILGKLRELDDVRENCDLNNPADKKIMFDEMSQTYTDLTKIRGLGPNEKDQLYMVKAYLNTKMQTLEGNTKTSEERGGEEKNTETTEKRNGENKIEEYARESAEYARASAEYAQGRAILEKQIEKVSLNEILDSYLLIRAPRERAPQMWEYKVPDFMDGMSQEKWRKLLSFEDAWLGAIYSKRQTSEYNNSLEKMKDGILNLKSLTEADLKTWYEDETLNLKGVMHEISRELLTKKTITDGNQTRTIYAFETRVNPVSGKEEYVGTNLKEFVDNEDIYKLALVKRLVEKKVVSNEEVAKLAVALSMDIMEMGGVFSVADGLRKLSWESDALRLAQRPERKFSSKVGGGELFAGPWTELANTLSQGDLKKAAELVKSWGVVPELLAGSFLDQPLDLGNGKETDKTMMEMIYNNEEIPFSKKENDLFFGWRKDHIMPAARMWMYISNKTPLEFSRNRENDAVISQWRTDLFNDVNILRENGDGIVSTEIIQGAIGGSVGLWPFEGPYLRINSDGKHGNGPIDYSESAIEIIRQLGLNSPESNQILRFFGVDKKFYKDLSDKFVAYTASKNLTLPEWYKRNSQKVLFRKRPAN